MWSPTIINMTRYNLEDLTALVQRFGPPWGHGSQRTWEVKYYTPTRSKHPYSASGPFVKMERNGDEANNLKKIGLVRPTNMPNVSPVEMLMCQTSGQVPEEMVVEIALRIKAIETYHMTCVPVTGAVFHNPHLREEIIRTIHVSNLKLRFTKP